MATGAADGFFRCVYDGCISGSDMGIERRPYHKNCGCALHNKSKNKKSSNYTNYCTHKNKNVSYPLRRSWSEGSLALNLTTPSANSSPSSSSPSLSSSSSASSLVKLQMGHYNYNCED